ncbi:MAG: membrane protein insertase YidC [Muribaculaceae bacterium]|nr:membrane protein insertase YidC [Muribaculaceae bacterium]MBQ7204598.1 membrane protein insertase YidC [Muribaculaceae bacterium]
MDKNTLIAMLLMGLVVFGFMWLQQPSEAEMAEYQRQLDSIEAVQKAQQRTDVTAGNVDTISAAEVTHLKSVLANMPEGNATINNEGVILSLKDGELNGTVTVADTTVTWAEVAAATSSNPAVHNLAVQAVQRALDVYAKNGSFAASLTGTEQLVTLENDSLKVELSTKGGIIARATLKGYKTYKTPQLLLFDKGDNDYSFTLSNNTQRFETKNFYFEPQHINDSTVLMNLNLEGGAQWGLKYTLVPGSYMVRMEMVQKSMSRLIPLNINLVDLDWHQKISRHEFGKQFEERNSGVYYKYAGKGGDVKHMSENGSDEDEVKEQLKWVSAKNQFFSTVLIADSVFTTANMTSNTTNDTPDYEKYLKDVNIHTMIPYSSDKAVPASFYFYLGPNRYHMLSSYDKYSPKEDLKLTHLIPLGWKFFRWINTGVIIPVFNWLGKFMSNYGLIILVLTILIKLILSPLTFKTYISQAKMRILAPDIAKINEQYPNQEDAMKKQQKTMELYRLAGANPMGGCLPMLLQMPILIAMFTFFPSCIELRGQSFLWANDLSAPDKILEWSGNIPILSSLFGNHLSLFCLLMTVTNIIFTWLTTKSQPSSNSMPGMKWMMYLMPLMFLFFFNNYAAGLSYYYFLFTLITILQTYLCRFFVSEDKVRATIAENSKKPKKKSKWMERLEEAQKQQQAMQRQQAKANNAKRRR